MDVTKIIKATAVRGRTSTAAPIIKEDYGLYLLIGGIDLPEVYEVDFSNDEHAGTSVTMVGNADGVLIPNQFIKSGKDVFAFYYHVGEDFGRTLYTIRIPNKLRPDRTNEAPTPEEQSLIDQAISALNTAVAKTAQDVISADQSARSASGDADRAEQARTGAETAQGKAEEAQESAERAKDDAETSERNASESERKAKGYAETANEKADSIHSMTASAQTLPAGSSAFASYNAGTGVMSFGIPKGDKGDKGDRGEQGIQGIQGERGLTGAKGDKGDKGDTGAQGIQGIQGEKGDTGEQGPQGEKGDKGDKGDTGEVSLADLNSALIEKAHVITDTASGAIASFSDGADDLPLKSLIVDINPIQDLHGQDAPYPAGGGVNQWDEEWELGTYSLTDGSAVASNYSIRGKNRIKALPSTDYYFNNQYFRVLFYDSNDAFISYVTGSGVKTTPNNTAYIRFYLGDVYGTTYNHDISINYPSTDHDYHPYKNICPISGWTEVGVEQRGINLFDIRRFAEVYPYHCTYDESADELTVSAQSQMYNTGVAVDIPLNATNGGYLQFEAENVTGTNFRIRIVCEDGSTIDMGGTGTATGYINFARVIPAKRIVAVRFNWSNSGEFKIKNFCMSPSQTATPYKPYTGRSITINLGQTVYGGHLDVLSGELVIDRHFVDPSQWTQYASSNGYKAYKNRNIPKALGVTNTTNKPLSNMISEFGTFSSGSMNKNIIQPPYPGYAQSEAYMALEDGIDPTNVEFSYIMQEPIEIQLTPNQVNSLLGVNNIWADSGDTTAVYRADTKLFIERLTAPDSADMVADANITSGKYFMVGNSLYKATANIANGSAIIVGTNCTRKSLSEALNEINA